MGSDEQMAASKHNLFIKDTKQDLRTVLYFSVLQYISTSQYFSTVASVYLKIMTDSLIRSHSLICELCRGEDLLCGQLWIQASVLTDCKHIRNFNSMFLWDHKLVFQSMMFLFQLWKVDTAASTVCIWVCCCISGVVSFTWRTVSLKDLLKLLMFKLRLFSWTLRWDLYGQLLRHNRCPLYSVSLAPEIFQ